MSSLSSIVDRVKGLTVDRVPTLRPAYPPVAVEMDPSEIVMVRLKRRGRGKPQLESHMARPMPEESRTTSVFRPTLTATGEIVQNVGKLFEATGTKPSRVSVIIPDNLAKISVLNLPDVPSSRKQLEDIVRFKLRRAVPFRLEDAVLSYQTLPGAERGLDLLVVLIRRFVVEQYEGILNAIGARPGLIDLCTPNLLNLCRGQIAELSAKGRDVALLNVAPGYFSLVIMRSGKPIFYRCKSMSLPEDPKAANGMLAREISNSVAYYRDKLSGGEIEHVLVRSVSHPLEDVISRMKELGFSEVEAVDPAGALDLAEGLKLDPAIAQRIAPAVGAAVGRAG